MLNVNAFEQQVAARLLDFFHSRAPWHRTLWTPGVRLVLDEVLEASEAVDQRVLTQPSLKNIANTAIELAGPDPGCGDAKHKRLLHETLKSELKFNGMEFHTLAAIAKDVESNYLGRWREVLVARPLQFSVERTARAIASHLLDIGFSPDFLHRWWKYRIVHQAGSRTLAEIVGDACELCAKPPTSFEVLTAFDAIPTLQQMPPRWMSAPEISTWLTHEGFNASGIRQNGGLLMDVPARDPYAAVELVNERIQNFAARVAVGTYGELKPVPNVWIKGEKKPFPLISTRRGAEVHSLQRENQLYVQGKLSLVDAAIAMLRPLNSGAASAAISGGWAAIETLLAGPGEERVEAADSLAAVVACSFPRAELTQLSYTLEKSEHPLGPRLAACATNRDRARLLADALAAGEGIALPDPSDAAAMERVRAISANPHGTLRDVAKYASAAFRRLYRCRNIILHWGRTEGEIRRTCLRTTAPLIGAGIDRIAHAWFIEKVQPRRFAAKALVNLEIVTSGGGNIVDLLE